jgi:membrane peptidoglycan carboxypeptidase
MDTQDKHQKQQQTSANISNRIENKAAVSQHTGGLLSSYRQQPESVQQSLPQSQQAQRQSPSVLPALPGSIGNSVKTPPASSSVQVPVTPPRGGLLSQHRAQQLRAGIPASRQGVDNYLLESQGLMNNTVQVMRRWSGRVSVISNRLAVMAGHRVLPPAPYMELYHPPLSECPSTPAIWRRSRVLRTALLMRRRRERWTHPKHLFSSLLIVLGMLVVLSCFGGTAYGYAYYSSQLPRLQELARQHISQTTRIYDRAGKLLFEAYDENEGRRSPVTYADIPQVMRDAQVAVEDESFWTNSGVDPQGIARAAVGYLQSASIQGGGSTITQQVIKNLTGDTDATLTRKIPEAALAIGLTQQYPKWKILEMYFNVAPFGPLDLGIEAAAQEYFHLQPMCDRHFKCTPGIARLNLNAATGKRDPLLGLARASLLAGLPQNPPGYYPAGNQTQRENALNRQKQVLGRMIAQRVEVEGLGAITPLLARKAEEMTARMKFRPYGYDRVKHAPHFVDWVMRQIETMLGNGDPGRGVVAFKTGGFNIHTTISLELEDYVERAVKRHLEGPSMGVYADGLPLKSEAHNVNTGAVVVLGAKSGEILAMNGSLDYNDDDLRVGGQFNAADPPPNEDGSAPGRPPGSTFKPFVYATSFEEGWYPGMAVPDYRTYFPKTGQEAGALIPDRPEDDGPEYMYAPPDYNKKGEWTYSNNKPATIRLALQESENIGALKAMKYAGPENVLNMVHRLGLTQVKRHDIAWALGTENATVLQMTSAYQTFANGGRRIAPQGILDIWDNYGHNLYHYDPALARSWQVMSPQVAFLVSSILIDEQSRAGEFGRDHVLSFSDVDESCTYQRACQHPVAAKTGTTDQLRDTWTVGYTPDVVVGTWTGNANGEPMQDVIGISGAAPIWHSVIETASGYCGASGDGIACPNDPRDFPQKSLGLSGTQTFKSPPGVTQRCTSSETGLLPLPGEATDCDWMIDNQGPQQSGSTALSPLDDNDFENIPGGNERGEIEIFPDE